MTFEEVLPALKDGKKITRGRIKDGIPVYYYFLEKREPLEGCGAYSGCTPYMTNSKMNLTIKAKVSFFELLTDDWVIVT